MSGPAHGWFIADPGPVERIAAIVRSRAAMLMPRENGHAE